MLKQAEIHRPKLTSAIGTITIANIIDVMIANRENCKSVANFVERILRLNRRDLEAAENVIVRV